MHLSTSNYCVDAFVARVRIVRLKLTIHNQVLALLHFAAANVAWFDQQCFGIRYVSSQILVSNVTWIPEGDAAVPLVVTECDVESGSQSATFVRLLAY